MARRHAHTPSPSPTHTSPVSRIPVLIEIPANEFSNAPSSTTPLARLKSRSQCKSPPHAWQRKLRDAEAVRNASMQSVSHRCRDHIQHVVNVVQDVKAERQRHLEERHNHLQESLQHAELRRHQLLNKRATETADERVRRAKNAREKNETLRRSFRCRSHEERREAQERRHRYISERKQRAQTFSPQGRLSLSPLASSPHGSSSGRSSMSFSSGEDVSRTIEFDDDVSFGDVSCLPISMDGNASDTDIRSSDSEPGQEVDDAQRMACASRIVSHYLLSKARAGLLNAGVIGEDVAKYSFAQVQAALESEAAQSAARLVLRAIGIHQGERPLTPRQAAKEQADCRILLSSLLFALHPHAVMEEKEPRVPSSGTHITQETMTLYCARRMLLCLHVGTLKAITSSWVMWRTAFLSWKKKDAESLLRAMIEDAVAADSMRIAVNRGFSQSANVQALRNVLGGREADFSPARSEHVAWEEQISQKQIEIREAIVRFAGEAGAKRLDAALTTSTHARNERMVHEILVDLPGLLHSIREERPVPEEIWERLRSQLSAQPPVRDELASRLASISQALNTLMPGSFNLNADEGPVELDVDFAVDIVIKAADSLKKSQAAAMDDALEQWLHDVLYQLQSAGSRLVHVIVDVLQQLTDLVRGVQTDVLMYRVKHSAPIVQQYGEVWARSHFESHIASGKFSDGLPWTKKLLSETLITSEQDENSGHVNMEEHSASSIRLLLTQSLVRMVTSLSICPPECMPEVFYLDHERIVKLQNDVQTCTVVSSLDNIGRQFLQSKGMPGSSSRLQQLSDIAQREDIRMEDIQETFVEWVRSESIRFGSTVTEEEVMLLQGMVKRISSPDDRTFSLMHRRVGQAIVELCSHIGSHLSGANSMERPHHGLMGLEAVDDILLAVAKRVYALVSHVSAVHGESITHILKSL